MKRKTLEQIRPKHPKNIWAGSNCTPDERMFVLLCLCGYSRTESFMRVFSPHIKASSASVQACNLAKQKNIQRAAQLLISAYADGEWELNTSILRPDIIDL